MKTHEEIAAYIVRCESAVAAYKEKIAAQELKQQDFEKAIKIYIDEAVAIANKPLLDLIRDIKLLKMR